MSVTRWFRFGLFPCLVFLLFSIFPVYSQDGIPGTAVFVSSVSIDLKKILIAPDGKFYLLAGYSSSSRLRRYNEDGSEDKTFNENAIYLTEGAVLSDGRILVTGTFAGASMGSRTGLVRLKIDGTIDPEFTAPVPVNSIRAITVQADGKILIVGGFGAIGGIARRGFARLNSDGTLDRTFQANVEGFLWDIIVPKTNGEILIGNQFYRVNGQARDGIALLANDGTLSTAFVPEFARTRDNQYATLDWLETLSEGKVLVAGSFDHVGAVPRIDVARLRADGKLDPTFDAGLIEGPASHTIGFAAPERNGKILIAGSFDRVQGQARNGIARLHTDGRLDLSYVSELPSSVRIEGLALLPDDSLLVVGYGNPQGGLPSQFVARLRGGELPPGPPRIVHQPVSQRVQVGQDVSFTIAASSASTAWYQWHMNGTVLPGETNATITIRNVQLDHTGAYYATALNADGASTSNAAVLAVRESPALPGTGDPLFRIGQGFGGGEVLALAVRKDGHIIAGGSFTTFDGIGRKGLVRLTGNGELDRTFDPGGGVNGRVNTLLLQPDDKLIVGGAFSGIDGQIRSNLFRLNSDGSLDKTFNPGTGPSAAVWALALQPDGKILIGGQFRDFSNRAFPRLVRLNTDGTMDPNFENGSPNGLVSAIALQRDGRILIGGTFGVVANSTRIGIARLHSDGKVDQDFNPGWGLGGYAPFTTPTFAQDTVRTIVPMDDGRVYIGGGFSRGNDQRREGIVRLLPNGGVDSSFFAVSGVFAIGGTHTISGIALEPDGRVVIAGLILEVNGERQQVMARLNSDGSLDRSFTSDFQGTSFGNSGTSATALVRLSSGNILVGGNFSIAGGLSRNGLAGIFSGSPSLAPPRINVRPFNIALPPAPSGRSSLSQNAISIQTGQDIILSTLVVSFEPCEYQWQIGGVNVPGATNPVFRINNFTTTPSGSIRLLARNSAGAVSSPSTTIEVSGMVARLGHVSPAFAPPGPVNGKVFSLDRQPDGKIVIAGSFLTVGDRFTPLVARLNADGSLDEFGPRWSRFDGFASVVKLQRDGKILVGGDFTAIRGNDAFPDAKLVRLKENGVVDERFSAKFDGDARIITIIQREDGAILV